MSKHLNSRPEMNTPEYKGWRNKVFALDGWKCVLCGSKGNLEAHHIVKWGSSVEKRYLVSNGVSLCQNCHQTVTGNEENFKNTFQNIVAQRMEAARNLSAKKARGRPWRPRDWRSKYGN